MKMAFLFSVATGILLIVAVYAGWVALTKSGVFDWLDALIVSVVSTPAEPAPFRITQIVYTQNVMGAAALVASIDVVAITAVTTVGSFVYNLAAAALGGVGITLIKEGSADS